MFHYNKLLWLLKQNVKMSLCVIWEKEKGEEYYICSDTRNVKDSGNLDEKGRPIYVVVNEDSQKFVIFKNLPIVLMSTGCSEFGNEKKILTEFVSEIETKLDVSKDIENICEDIAKLFQKGLSERITQFLQDAKDWSQKKIDDVINLMSIELMLFYKDRNNNLNHKYYFIIEKEIYNDKKLSPAKLDAQCGNIYSLGNSNAISEFHLTFRKKENENGYISDLTLYIQEIFSEVYKKMCAASYPIINDKLDIVRLSRDEINLIEKNSIK